MSEADNVSRWNGGRGRYEVWFLTMSEAAGDRGFWIRYTLRAPVAGPAERRVWFARFDREDPGRTFGVNAPLLGPARRAALFDEPDATLGSGAASGRIDGGGHRVRWDVRWPTGSPSVHLLPAPLHRGAVSTTRPSTPNPDVRFAGTIEVDGEAIDLDGFSGVQGHGEGSRHAERWAWTHLTDRDASFEAVSAQGRKGPLLTPFLTFAGLHVDGRWIRLRGATRRRTWGLGTWRLQLHAKSVRVEGEVRVAREHLLRARYLDPDDTPRWCHHSDVASARLMVWERRAGGWQELTTLEAPAQAEWAGRTPAPGVDRVHEDVA